MTHAIDTIFALSSGRPPAAIAVVRISGPRAGDALRALIGRVPEPRKASLARVRDGGELIDEALALWFPAPNSETGEDMAELQLHGGRAVIAAVFAALARIDGVRAAEAGEFTRRAFDNGKLDLTRVEGLADLIAADTEAQRRQAFLQLRGLLGDKAERWRAQLIEALALVEAQIDFPDEGDVPQDLVTPALAIARTLRDEIAQTLNDRGRGERLRDGLVVAIAGPPNAGKSSLLNRLARREAAIVSPFAGTTRDVIEVHLDLDGYPVTLLDTAGIRASDDPVEQEGVRRAQERAAAADLVLWVVDATQGEGAVLSVTGHADANADGVHQAGASPRRTGEAGLVRPAAAGDLDFRPASPGRRNPQADTDSRPGMRTPGLQGPDMRAAGGQSAGPVNASAGPGIPRSRDTGSPAVAVAMANDGIAEFGPSLSSPPKEANVGFQAAVWTIRNKIDLVPQAGSTPRNTNPSDVSRKKDNQDSSSSDIDDRLYFISATTGEGVSQLLAAVAAFAGRFLGSTEPALVTRSRQRQTLADAWQALDRLFAEDTPIKRDTIQNEPALVAEELRLAARALGRLTGRIDVEDILDVIFRDFCIGK